MVSQKSRIDTMYQRYVSDMLYGYAPPPLFQALQVYQCKPVKW
jgi:hypothetical protein